jgi:hypothetical protein
MDVLGLTYAEYSAAEREAVVSAFPRTPRFKEDIIQAFYDGIKHKPGRARLEQGGRELGRIRPIERHAVLIYPGVPAAWARCH